MNSFPNKASYHTLTKTDTLNAKKHNGIKKEKATPTATLMPTEVVVPVAVVMSFAVFGDRSDSEDVEAPFFVPHFFFDCSIGHSSVSTELSVWALIDDSSDTVPINPTYVNCLSLTPCKLPALKEVIMVVGKGVKEVFLFDEWVPVTVISSDQAWTSHICKAILAPNLCVPILLGNPFLATNGIIIDHELHTCIDKHFGYNLLNPPNITQNTIKLWPCFGPELKKLQKSIVADIGSLLLKMLRKLDMTTSSGDPCPIATIQTRMEVLVTDKVL